MQEHDLHAMNENAAMTLIHQVAFFKDLFTANPDDYYSLIHHSRIIDFAANEVISIKAEQDSCFYGLIKGSVDVFKDESVTPLAISQLSCGQLFGALSVLNSQPRTATLAASSPSGATVIVTDYSYAGKAEDFSCISLLAKIKLFRNVVNNIKWKLQVYKNQTDDPTLAQELTLFPPFIGAKDTLEELRYLVTQCQDLTDLLAAWNDVIDPDVPIILADDTKTLKRVFSFLKKKPSQPINH